MPSSQFITTATDKVALQASTTVIRVSRGRFDPAQFAEVDEMIKRTGEYLIPAIQKLPGLISYHAATSPDGFTTQISIWESEQAGQQMRALPEMRDRARAEAEALGVVFEPIIQYPISWTVASSMCCITPSISGM